MKALLNGFTTMIGQISSRLEKLTIVVDAMRASSIHDLDMREIDGHLQRSNFQFLQKVHIVTIYDDGVEGWVREMFPQCFARGIMQYGGLEYRRAKR